MSCKKEDTSEAKPVYTITNTQLIFQQLNTSIEVTKSPYEQNDSLIVKLSSPIDSVITVRDNNYDRKFKIIITNISVTNTETSEKIPSANFSIIDKGNNLLQIEFKSLHYANYKFSASFDFEFYELNNGVWEALLDNNNIALTINKAISFQTAKLNTNIVECNLSNIEILKEVLFPNQLMAEVKFNYSPDSTFLVTRDNHTFVKGRANIKKIELLNGQTVISCSTAWTNATTYTLTPTTILDDAQEYQLHIVVEYEEETTDGWIPLKNSLGNVISEEQTYSFSTPEDKANSLDRYIQASYPLSRQFNFYKDEYSQGYFMFYYGPTLLPQIENNAVSFKFIKLPSGDVISESQGRIDEKTIWFDIPTNLENETPYRLQMIANNNVVHQIEFRVSKYNTIGEKIPDSRNVRFLYDADVPNSTQKADCMGSTIYPEQTVDECFDYYETTGLNGEKLIQITPVLSDWDWYTLSIYKQMYNTFTASNNLIQLTEPSRGLYSLWQIDYNRKLTDDEILSGTFSYEAEMTHIVSYLPISWATDYLNVRAALLEKYTSTTLPDNTVYQYIYKNSYFPNPQNGNYSINLQYKLPGKNIVTYEKKINITMSIY